MKTEKLSVSNSELQKKLDACKAKEIDLEQKVNQLMEDKENAEKIFI